MCRRVPTIAVLLLCAAGCTTSGGSVGSIETLTSTAAEDGPGSGETAGGGSGPGATSVAEESSASASSSATSATGPSLDDTSGTTVGSNDDGPIFDVGTIPDGGNTCGDDSSVSFSTIWIASQSTGTVYRVDTFTGTIEGRYYTEPSMGRGSPSRTSVNLQGDVAVSNRASAGVTKIAGSLDRCVDLDGNGTIETSTGPEDVLPWGEDECVLWHRDFPDAIANKGVRPTQWEAGVAPGFPCGDPNPRLWVGYLATGEVARFVRLDGSDGAILDTAEVSGVFTDHPHHRPYGGVVDAEGDLWAIGHGSGDTGPLLHIDADTLEVTNYGNPIGSFYGLTIDADGNPWACSRNLAATQAAVFRFDAVTETFSEVLVTGGASLRGCAADEAGRLWAAANNPCGLVEIDMATQTQVGPQIELPGCVTPVGVSIDVEGYVWVVDSGGDQAYKVDPVTHNVEILVENLITPYTYSDMTGAGLGLVSGPQG
ncbi:MAG: hypothetical protein AAF799_21185 [Myxococcota bacterium]